MRNATALVCLLILFLGFGDPSTLRPRRLKAFAPVVLSASPPPQIPVSQGFQSIGANDVATGTVIPSSTQVYYEFIAPSNGTLMITLDFDGSLGFLALFGQGAQFFHFRFEPPAVVALPVAAGGIYRFSVEGGSYWAYYFNDPVPFVLTTSLELGPVVIPGICEGAPPAPDWLCVRGNVWVPRDHPLAAPIPPAAPPVPPPVGDGSCLAIQPAPTWICLNGVWLPPSVVPPAPATPATPPVVNATGCVSIQPAATWVCVNGNWLPSDHPLALTAQPAPAPPTSPPPTTPCPPPDPFAGIPGLSGVCVDGNWVPVGHPLARGGG